LKQKSLHQRVVNEILPKFSERLLQEGIISSYDRRTFKIKLKYHEDFPSFVIKPDLFLTLPDEKRFLIEVVNPRDPKRLMGELACIQFLGYHNLIDAGWVFLLPRGPESVKAPAKGLRLWQSGQFLKEVLGSKVPSAIVSWSTKEDNNYSNLKNWILGRRPSWWLK